MSEYSKKKIKECFLKLNLKKGDIVFCHSNIGYFGKIINIQNKDQLCELFYNELLNVIGKEGTLIVPTFTYSFFNKENFTISKPSKMGIFSEWVRKKRNSSRSLDPNFSVSAIGPLKEYFIENTKKETYDLNSFFGKFHSSNGKILNFNFPGSTIIHYYEKMLKVNYRFEKKFYGKVNGKKEIWSVFSRYLKKDFIHNPFKLMRLLREKKSNTFFPLGKGEVFALNSKSMFKFIEKKILKNKNLLINKI